MAVSLSTHDSIENENVATARASFMLAASAAGRHFAVAKAGVHGMFIATAGGEPCENKSMIDLNPRDSALMALARSIIADDAAGALRLLAASPLLARACFEEGATRQTAQDYLDEIGRYVYAGDTALHVAAGTYRTDVVQKLIAMGADVHARNRRGAEPLHAAAVGMPGSQAWNPLTQAATITCLIRAGADPNAVDNSGVTALHRAVRTRCAAAVKTLLDGGADARRKNKSGSTPMRLATANTGRGGSGSPEAKAQQQEIQRLLRQHGPTG